MPKISISSETFVRLQKMSVPLVDTVDSVIKRALNALENEMDKSDQENSKVDQEAEVEKKIKAADQNRKFEENSNLPVLKIDTDNLPDVTSSKLLDAKINDQSVENPRWNKILIKLLELACSKNMSATELSSTFDLRIKSDEVTEFGYKYLPKINMSIPPLNANETLRVIVGIAIEFKINMTINFIWRAKEGALYPGRKARIET